MQSAVWGQFGTRTPRICIHVGLCRFVACVTFGGSRCLEASFIFPSVEGPPSSLHSAGETWKTVEQASGRQRLTVTVRSSGKGPVSVWRGGVLVQSTCEWEQCVGGDW